MAPKQSTLGSFFKKSGCANPAPTQQTKLSFATRSSPKQKDRKQAEPETNGRNDRNGTEDARESLDKDDKKRGRRASKDVEEDGEAASEEEGPVAKRARRNRRRVVLDEDDDDDVVAKVEEHAVVKEEASEPVKTTTIKEVGSPNPRSRSRSRSPTKKEVATPEDTSGASTSESESTASEDEKPAAKVKKAKARQAVQTILTSGQAKDAYPDWKAGEPVPYAALCATFSLIELTAKRLVIMEHCSVFLRQVMRLTPEDLLPTILLMINKLAPDYAGIELGIGESLIMKAIGETTGRSLQVIKQDQKEVGDLGLVAVKSKSTQRTMFKPKPLTVRGVHKGLMEIATTAGSGSQGHKVDGIKKLLASADVGSGGARVDITKDKGGPSEAKFIVRFLEGKLRLGLAERTVLPSLAQAAVAHEAAVKGTVPTKADVDQGEAILKAVYSELPSYDVIIPALLADGIMRLRESCHLRPGVPLKPMLAKPTKAITEVLDRFENQTFTCEYKYDGERAQIHYVAADAPQQDRDDMSRPSAGVTTASVGKGVACIFSRNSEDLSKKYPDVLARLHTWVRDDTKSFVLDCETVAWDVDEKKVLPFQQLMTRKRKDVKIEDVKVKVCIFAFDLLYFNGEAVVQRPLRERRELLAGAFVPAEGEFSFATHMNSQELEDIQTFLDESVKASCEGLMVKMLDGAESGYEPSKRSRNWLKIKKDYLTGVGDSLDLVVIGAYFGKGKRTSVYGAFLLASYNPGTEKYETICKVGTGFSEQVLESLHADLSQLAIDRPKPFYDHSSVTQHQPDVWFEPRQVWEVRTADLTLSPRYKAGSHEGVDPKGEDRGISLRFPRFVRVRDDKKPDEATTSRQVAEMYRKQEIVSKTKGVDDDFEY